MNLGKPEMIVGDAKEPNGKRRFIYEPIAINKPIKVSRMQYALFKTHFSGVVAFRFDKKENQFYIKPMTTGHLLKVASLLNESYGK